MAKVRELFKHSLIYGGGKGIGKVAALLLLPIYTRYLTPADYGILAILLATSGVAHFFGELGQGPAMFREIIYEDSDVRKVTSTVLFSLLVIGFVLYALLIFFHHLFLCYCLVPENIRTHCAFYSSQDFSIHPQ